MGVFCGKYVTEVPEGYLGHLSELRSGKKTQKPGLTIVKFGGEEGGVVATYLGYLGSSGTANGLSQRVEVANALRNRGEMGRPIGIERGAVPLDGSNELARLPGDGRPVSEKPPFPGFEVGTLSRYLQILRGKLPEDFDRLSSVIRYICRYTLCRYLGTYVHCSHMAAMPRAAL